MVAIEKELITTDANGKPIVRAFIVADTTPDTMPTTGSGIENMTEDETIGVFSMLYVIGSAALYIMNSQGTFVNQSSSSSDEGGEQIAPPEMV